MLQMARSMACELGAEGIRVKYVLPALPAICTNDSVARSRQAIYTQSTFR